MVQGVEDLRTPLSTILHLEEQIRGSIAGFMMPSFVVDLPGGGGKRLAASYKTYNRKTGISTFVAPAVGKGENKIFEYYDPLWSVQETPTALATGSAGFPVAPVLNPAVQAQMEETKNDTAEAKLLTLNT
jgi:hypothetical protein